MNELMTITNSPEFGEVRTVLRDGEPWFVAKDVCDILGIANSRDAVSRLDEDEKGVGKADTLGGKQEVSIVNEFGLYQLTLRSNKPEAKQFKRWVTHDVLPTLRKQGYYSMMKDEDLLAILTERRKEDSTYLFDDLMKARERLAEERWEETRKLWIYHRFDLDTKEVDKKIEEIWKGDIVGAEKARNHYFECCQSRYGMSRIYGKWKRPKSDKKTFKREKELIELYERQALRKKLDEIKEAEGCRLEDCKNQIDQLDRQDRALIKNYFEIKALKAENERLRNMVNAAMN